MKALLTFCNLLVVSTVISQTANESFRKKVTPVVNPLGTGNHLHKQSGTNLFIKYSVVNAITEAQTIKKDSIASIAVGNKIFLEKDVLSATYLANYFGAISGGLVSTLAGSPLAGDKNAFGATAMFNLPQAVAADATGNVYVADANNNKIKKVTPAGEVTTFAGSGLVGCTDGTTKASFYYPAGVAVDASGNVYVADKGNHKIRKITATGVVSTLAGTGIRADIDGQANKACFNKPVSIAVDALGNVYVADECNHKIKKITPVGYVSTLAGNGKPGSADGIGMKASFSNPSGVAVDNSGNVYVSDYGNNRIRKITPNGLVSTLAGSDTIGSMDGPAKKATFYFPNAIAVDGNANIYIADQLNNKIRKLTIAGVVSTIAGNGIAGSIDGCSSKASFNNPAGITVDASGYLYIADCNNHKIRKIDLLNIEEDKKKENTDFQKGKNPNSVMVNK